MQRNVYTWGRHLLLSILIAVFLLGSGLPGFAQEQPAPQQASVAAAVVTPQSLMADQLMRLTDQILREKAPPGSSQLIRAGMMVDLAIQTNPNDADAWLMRKTLAQMAGDTDAAIDALNHYCHLNPGDDAAGFQLILAGLRNKSTAQEKATALEKLLNSAAKDRMTDAMRSRVAGYLATLYQNMGDQTRFGKWLKVAAELDESNSDAARMMYELAVSRTGSDYAVGQMLIHMIKSAPMDDMPRHMLADLLAQMGAYDAAVKQYTLASTLGVKSGGDKFLTNWMVSMAASGQSSDVLKMIDSLGFTAGKADPSAVPIDAQVLKLALLSQDGRTSDATETFKVIRNKFQQRVDMGDVQAALELAWWTAAFGPNLSPSFEQAVQAYAKANPDNVLIQRTLGWVYYRKGQIEQAANVLHGLAETDPWSVYGLAKCTESSNSELREGYLQKTIRMDATSPAAMLAARDLAAMGKHVSNNANATALIDQINGLPSSILMPLQTRDNVWTTLSVDVQPTQYGYLEPITAIVSLRNSSDYPLALGSSGTLPTNMAIYLAPRRGGEPIKGMAPIRVDLAHRIRLGARETIKVPVRLDCGELGMMMANNPAATIGFSVTAVLDPRNTAQGGLTTGPLGGVALVKYIDRTALRPTPGNIDAWLGQFKAPKDAISHMKLIASLCRLSDSLNRLVDTREQATHIASTVNAQFANLGTLGQAWMALFIPSGAAGQSLFPNVCQGAGNSKDTMVRLAYLATHGKDDAAAVTAAASSTDPRVGAFAKALQTP